MSRVFISPLAHRQVTEYLAGLGHKVIFTEPESAFSEAVRLHPDLKICKLGTDPGAPAVFARHRAVGGYPGEASMCALCIGKHLIHRPDITAPEILSAAKDYTFIPVRQGYAKCSCTAVSDSAVVTADVGIASALKKHGGISVLMISPGHVLLPGYNTGFIGGASGRVGDEIIFNGSLAFHPDGDKIRKFILSEGLKVRDFPRLPLTDIGSIIEVQEEAYVKFEKSCGAVIYRQGESGLKFLLIKQKAGHWASPKGHIEGYETEKECALREILEETGIVADIDTEFRREREYSPKPGVWKKVVYFIGRAVGGSEKPQEAEVSELCWYTLEEAVEKITFADDRTLITDAVQYLKGKNK